MCNTEQLIGYLYDDLPAAERAAFEGHVAACPRCRQELADLQQTRRHLAAWAPPQPAVNFRLVPSAPGAAAAAAKPRRRVAFVPDWALAAAASLLMLAGAAAVANLEVRYGAGGLVVRTGWAPSVPAGGPAAPAVSTPVSSEAGAGAASAAPVRASSSPDAVPQAGAGAAASDHSEELKAQVAALARRLQELERGRTAERARLASAIQPGITAPELRKILAESESRQRAEMAIQMQKLWNDFNATRAADFVRVQRTFAPELQRQQRLIDNVIHRTSTQK